jgi:hypothetical protein
MCRCTEGWFANYLKVIIDVLILDFDFEFGLIFKSSPLERDWGCVYTLAR